MNQDELKRQAAEKALEFLPDGGVLGIGTGSSANLFIDNLATVKGQISATVASSEASADRLRKHGIPVYDLNTVNQVDFYIDGADEADDNEAKKQHRRLAPRAQPGTVIRLGPVSALQQVDPATCRYRDRQPRQHAVRQEIDVDAGQLMP